MAGFAQVAVLRQGGADSDSASARPGRRAAAAGPPAVRVRRRGLQAVPTASEDPLAAAAEPTKYALDHVFPSAAIEVSELNTSALRSRIRLT